MKKKARKIENPESYVLLKTGLEESERYYHNGKETLKRLEIKNNRYSDPKYVSEAAAIGYLAALKAIDSFLLYKGWHEMDLPQSIEHYRSVLNKYSVNKRIIDYLNTAYQNLHLFAYYRGGVSTGLVKDGFDAVNKIINYFCGFTK